MNGRVFPSVFVSHGAPTLATDQNPAHEFLRSLGKSLGKPRAVLVVSAHWETSIPTASAATKPETIHDFGGFPEELYRLRYPAPGAPELAALTLRVLRDAGLKCTESLDRGLDHGAWIPLMLMYPDADIPVAQLSVQPQNGPVTHVEIGRALEPLRHDGVLILGSGGAVHNLSSVGGVDVPDWATNFDEWLYKKITSAAYAEVVNYRSKHADSVKAHPTEEHLLPLFVALGAGGKGTLAHCLHRSFSYGTLSMAAYSFESSEAYRNDLKDMAQRAEWVE